MKKISLRYLEKVQDYVHERAFQEEAGYDEKTAEWSNTPQGAIGLSLARISASIEVIREIRELNKLKIMED